MDRIEHLPAGDAYHTRGQFADSEEERHWRGRLPVFTSLVHVDGGTMGRNTAIAAGAEIEATDRTYTVGRDGALRREGHFRGLSKKERARLKKVTRFEAAR